MYCVDLGESFFIFERRAAKEIRKEFKRPRLLGRIHNRKCAESLHAFVLDRETVQKCGQLVTQPEMFQNIKP